MPHSALHVSQISWRTTRQSSRCPSATSQTPRRCRCCRASSRPRRGWHCTAAAGPTAWRSCASSSSRAPSHPQARRAGIGPVIPRVAVIQPTHQKAPCLCRMGRAPDQAGQASGSRAVSFTASTDLSPDGGPSGRPHRTGFAVGIGLRRWDDITLGDGEGQGERAPSRRSGLAISWLVPPPQRPIRMICAGTRRAAENGGRVFARAMARRRRSRAARTYLAATGRL